MMMQKKRFIFFLVLVPALAMLYYVADARYVSFFPRCPLNYFTGLFCPGCGSQRAFSALLHGHVGQAFQYNGLMMASLPFLMYSGGVAVLNRFAHTPLPQAIFYKTFFVKTVLVVVLSFWLLRNIPVQPFSYLAPMP